LLGLIVTAYFLLVLAVLRTATDWIVEIYLPLRDVVLIGGVIAASNFSLFWMSLAGLVCMLPGNSENPGWDLLIEVVVGTSVCLLADTIILGRMIKDPATRKPIGMKDGAKIAWILVAIYILCQIGLTRILRIIMETWSLA
jgi:hypothetical protein